MIAVKEEKKMKRKNVLKEAGVLLTAAILILTALFVFTPMTKVVKASTTIFTNGFENWFPGSGGTWPPTGWGTFDRDGDGQNWYLINYDTYAHTGSASTYTYDYEAEDNWLVSNQTSISPSGGTFSLYDCGYWGNGHTIEIWFCPSTIGNTPDDFLSDPQQKLSTINVQDSTVINLNWEHDQVSIPQAFWGQTGYFAIRDTTPAYIYDYLFLDDITFPNNWFQGFETIPGYFSDWTSVMVSGTDSHNKWEGVYTDTYPPYCSPPHGGSWMAGYYSYVVPSGGSARLQYNTPILIDDTADPSLNLWALNFWMYHDSGYSGSSDTVSVQVQDPSGSWVPVGSPFYRNVGSGWMPHSVDLSIYHGSSVYIGFLGTSDYGNDMYIDDVEIIGYFFVNTPPTSADNTVTTLEDTTYTFQVSDFPFSDVDGDTFKGIEVMSTVSGGTLKNGITPITSIMTPYAITDAEIATGQLTYEPLLNANGVHYDSFGFTVFDGTDYSTATYTMWIDVTPVNDPPTAPTLISPTNGAIDQSPCSLCLSWLGSTDPDVGDTITYNVYLSTTSPPSASPPVDNVLSGPWCPPIGTFCSNTRYYWNIGAVDSAGAETLGVAWSFDTTTTGFSMTNPFVLSEPIMVGGSPVVIKSIQVKVTNGGTSPVSGVTVEMKFIITTPSSPPYGTTSTLSLEYQKPTGSIAGTLAQWTVPGWPSSGAAHIKSFSVKPKGCAYFDVVVTVYKCSTSGSFVIQKTMHGCVVDPIVG